MPSYLDERPLDAIVIGAGFGGCYLLRNLRKQGFRVRVFEEGNGLGGVWHHNRYPGARVDTNVPFYEFSDPDIWKHWDWTEEYPSQQEILRYFEFVDEKWDLSRDITFGARVTDASFDQKERTWTIKTDKGHTATAPFLIPAMGFASKIYTPSIKGLESFQGFQRHTAKFPESPVDFTGKRVGIVGTGATGVQLIQELAPVARSLVVFQRSPNCALPMRQKSYGVHQESRPDKNHYQEKFREMKQTKSGFDYPTINRNTFEDTPEQRLALWEKLWERGGFAPSYGNYPDMATNLQANTAFYNFWRDKTRARLLINDPELIENLAPELPPFPFGTKRPSLERSFYEVFNQPNVSLIALKKNPIDEVTAKSVRMANGTEIELDAIILATGFDAVTGSFSRVNIKGSKGKSLNQEWGGGSRTFLGMTTSGFPNMLYLYGPQSPSAWAIGPIISEIQSDWVINTLVFMRNRGYTYIEPRSESEKMWSRVTNEEFEKTLLGLNETTWYMGANVPGKPRECLNYVGGLPLYQEALAKTSSSNWSGFSMY